jgi:hypothetical protein
MAADTAVYGFMPGAYGAPRRSARDGQTSPSDYPCCGSESRTLANKRGPRIPSGGVTPRGWRNGIANDRNVRWADAAVHESGIGKESSAPPKLSPLLEDLQTHFGGIDTTRALDPAVAPMRNASVDRDPAHDLGKNLLTDWGNSSDLPSA